MLQLPKIKTWSKKPWKKGASQRFSKRIFLGGRLGNLFVFEPFKAPSVWEGGRLGLICHLFSCGLENPSICSFYLQLVGKVLKVLWSHMFNTQGTALQDALNSLRSIVKLVIGIVITLVTFYKIGYNDSSHCGSFRNAILTNFFVCKWKWKTTPTGTGTPKGLGISHLNRCWRPHSLLELHQFSCAGIRLAACGYGQETVDLWPIEVLLMDERRSVSCWEYDTSVGLELCRRVGYFALNHSLTILVAEIHQLGRYRLDTG